MARDKQNASLQTIKKPVETGFFGMGVAAGLALTRLEAGVGFVDDVDAALAANYAAIFITLFGGFQ